MRKHMYKELATIKDGDEIKGFVVHDGNEVSIMDVDQMKKEAAAGNVDTLYYEDGQFIPILQGEIAKQIKRKRPIVLRNHRKVLKTMTFEDFVNADVLFSQEDVDIMDNDNHTVLACVAGALEIQMSTAPNAWRLVVGFWGKHEEDVDRIWNHLMSYGNVAKTAKRYGNFFMVNLPMRDNETNFGIISFWRDTGVNLIYNLESMDTIDQRFDRLTACMPRFVRNFYEKMRPTTNGVYALKCVLMASNKMAAKKLNKEVETC